VYCRNAKKKYASQMPIIHWWLVPIAREGIFSQNTGIFHKFIIQNSGKPIIVHINRISNTWRI
jgi:hypothetical protein